MAGRSARADPALHAGCDKVNLDHVPVGDVGLGAIGDLVALGTSLVVPSAGD